MKTRTIKNILHKKHKRWVESITDESVRTIAKEGTFITGGAVASLFDTGEINDLDIYFKDTYTAYVVTNYYINIWNKKKVTRQAEVFIDDGTPMETNPTGLKVKVNVDGLEGKTYPVKLFIRSEGVAENMELVNEGKNNKEVNEADKDDDNPKFIPRFITDNALSLTNDVQLILRFVGTPTEIHANFDYVHCTCWYYPKTRELGLPQDALVAILTKELTYIGSKFPLCSLFRMRKFIDRGFSINAGQILKMVFQLQALNLNDPDVMREQLIGVDTFYMQTFINAYNEYIEDNGKAPTGTYLVELIDKVFTDETTSIYEEQ